LNRTMELSFHGDIVTLRLRYCKSSNFWNHMKDTRFNRSQTIAAYPLAVQEPGLTLIFGHCRKVFNLLLGINNYRWQLVAQGKASWKDFDELDDELTKIKSLPEYAYLYEAPAQTLQQEVKHLKRAISGAIKHTARAPNFKRKDAYRQSFTVTNQEGAIVYRGSKAYFKCPKLKKLCGNELIRLAEKPRFDCKIMSYTVIKEGDDWRVVIHFDFAADPRKCQHPDSVCGVDVGIKNPAVCSDGTVLELPDTSKEEAKIRYYQSKMDRSRHVNGRNRPVSKRFKKFQKKRRAIEKRITNKRKDAIHKFTHTVTNSHGTVVVETLDITRMMRSLPGRGARRACKRAMLGEILRQLKYKALHCVEAAWNYPSSQICSRCGHRHKMPLDQRTYVCPHCGLVIDRDLNAAINLANYISQPGQG